MDENYIDLNGKSQEYEKNFNQVSEELGEFIDIPLQVNVVIGEKNVKLRDLLDMEPGTLLVLNRSAGESLLIYLNDTFFAKGEVTILEDTFAVRITEINDPRRV